MNVSSEKKRSFWRLDWLASARLEGFAHLATMVAVVIGVISISSQSREFSQQVALNREFEIAQRWNEHMRLAIDYPQFAVGPKMASLSSEDREKYVWFVENMIFAGERIIQYAPDDPQWINTLIYDLRIQRDYVISDEFLGCPKDRTTAIKNCSISPSGTYSSSYCTYIPKLREVVRLAFREDRVASLRLNAAEHHCHWDQPYLIIGTQPNA